MLLRKGTVMKGKVVLLLLVSSLTTLPAKSGEKLTFDQVYNRAEPRLLTSLPSIRGWWDQNHYLELVNHDRLVRINAGSGDTTLVVDYKTREALLPEGFSLRRAADRTEDYRKFILQKDGNLYFFNRDEEDLKPLTAQALEEKNPTLSPNGNAVAYTRNHNLYVLDLETGLERQLTDDGSDVIYNGWASWVYYEEILGRRSRYKAFWWSPNSDMIAFLRFDDSRVPRFPLYKADGKQGLLEWMHYPKAGDPVPDVKLGVVHIKDGRIVWIDIENRADNYVAWPTWTPDGKTLIYQWMNRDQNLLKLFAVDPLDGKSATVYTEKQDSWVSFIEDLHVLKDNQFCLFKSDKSGWSHLYLCSLDGKKIKQLTRGDWSVRDIERLDENHEKIYFHANKRSTETQLFCIDINGKNLRQITHKPGTHRCQVSPTGTYFIDTFEDIHHPGQMILFTTRGDTLRKLGDRRLAEMDHYQFGTPELFTIPSGDGYDLPACWILPPDFDQSKKYPVLFSVYGGPGSKSVTNDFHRLSNYYLAQNQIIYLAVDHRGSGHFGKKGKALMHRNLGKWEMHDLIAAVKWLQKKPFVDSTKIAITGGSYGGYVTCMALTFASEYFTHGIALFSVTDWHLYDNVYTERYMDHPDDNPQGYSFGSVMSHAKKYKGKLLITHGTMDDNVHMQNTIQLIDVLQDHNKNFDLMLYPNERHGIGFPKYKHQIRKTLDFWFAHLLDKPFNPEQH